MEIMNNEFIDQLTFLSYSINVVANYALANSKHSYEIQTKSQPIMYTTSASAQPMSLQIRSLDPNKVKWLIWYNYLFLAD